MSNSVCRLHHCGMMKQSSRSGYRAVTSVVVQSVNVPSAYTESLIHADI